MYFTDYYKVQPENLEKYGALNISLVTDLPLFIDPFLIFNSEREEYKLLHDEMIKYLRFLRDKALGETDIRQGLINSWYKFSEVSQNWLGFSVGGNQGRGLGNEFAHSLHRNLFTIFQDFADEQITQNSHLEKLCLIKDGVGRDNISDFTTNLIKDYLLKYTEKFTKDNIDSEYLKEFTVTKAFFNYETETWTPKKYTLPVFKRDFVILTPKDMLTRDDTWINKSDLISNFDDIPLAVSDVELRAEINNYFAKLLPKDPTKKDRSIAAIGTIKKYPVLVDYYIKQKEMNGDLAMSLSSEKVEQTENLLIVNMKKLIQLLEEKTNFYQIQPNSYEESLQRIEYLKNAIEKNDGYSMFYIDGEPRGDEKILQIAFRLVWFGSKFDVNSEVNNGRGPADYKVSLGSMDKTVIEMKLARNRQLKRNLLNQSKIYAEANNTKKKIVVVIFFTAKEEESVKKILSENTEDLEGQEIVLIDARDDNKPSASKA